MIKMYEQFELLSGLVSVAGFILIFVGIIMTVILSVQMIKTKCTNIAPMFTVPILLIIFGALFLYGSYNILIGGLQYGTV